MRHITMSCVGKSTPLPLASSAVFLALAFSFSLVRVFVLQKNKNNRNSTKCILGQQASQQTTHNSHAHVAFETYICNTLYTSKA